MKREDAALLEAVLVLSKAHLRWTADFVSRRDPIVREEISRGGGVYLEPDGTDRQFRVEGNRIKISLPNVEFHGMIVIE